MKKLTKKDILIVEEFLSNGFNKSKSFATQYPNHTKKSIGTESSRFFKQPHIKEYVEQRLEEQLESKKMITNKLLSSLDYDCFERELDEEFTWKEKQNSQKLLMGLLKQMDFDEKPKEEVIHIHLVEDED